MFLRLEDKTPPVYTRESRDFQLFLRLCDCINNMIIDDADNLKNITNTNVIFFYYFFLLRKENNPP